MTGPSDIHSVNLNNGVNFIITIADRSKSTKEETDTKEHKKVYELLDKCKVSIEKNTGFTEDGVKHAQIAVESAKKALDAKDAESIAKNNKKSDTGADAGANAGKNNTSTGANQKGGFFSAPTAVIVEKGQDNQTYTYAGEVKTIQSTNTINGHGVIILGERETGQSRAQILSQDTYSYAGQFDKGQKNGFGIETGLEKLSTSSAKEKHYYVGKFDKGKRCGGAYAIGSNTVYIGDFGKEVSTFNGFGCWRQDDQMFFGEFEGKEAGAVEAKFKYPLIYAKDSDIRLYDSSSNFVIFESDVTAKIRKIIDSIKLREIYSQMSTYYNTLYELKNPLQSVWNYSTTSYTTIGATAVAVAAAAGIYYLGSKWLKKKPAASQDLSGNASEKVDSKGPSGIASVADSKGASANGSQEKPIKTEKKTRVTKAQLQAKAKDLKIEYKDSDTAAMLKRRIEAAERAKSNRRTMRKSRGSRSKR
jgi:hypothetical protein